MDDNFEQNLNVESNEYNIKSIFTSKGGIGRLHYFINNLIINLSCILIITIPFAMVYTLFNIKKRLFDITQDEKKSWTWAVIIFVLGIIASFIPPLIIVNLIIGLYLLFCKGK